MGVMNFFALKTQARHLGFQNILTRTLSKALTLYRALITNLSSSNMYLLFSLSYTEFQFMPRYCLTACHINFTTKILKL
jgi:hypothetical protein